MELAKRGKLRNTFETEYVPEASGGFLEAHKALMRDAMTWGTKAAAAYNLDMMRGEFVHEVMPDHMSRTPGRRLLKLTAQFYSYDPQETVDAKQEHLRRQLQAIRVGATTEHTPQAS